MDTSARPKPGWIIEVDGRYLNAPKQRAEIVELFGVAEHEHYRVRWEDGRESIFFPAIDAQAHPPLREGIELFRGGA